MIRFISIAAICTALSLLTWNIATQHGGITTFGPELGGDYPAFYLAGQTLNTDPDRLYDLPRQEELFHQLIPDAPNHFLFYPGAPFLAVLFRPLALLPYTWSYLAWLGIGAALALASFWLLWRACGKTGNWLTALLACLSFAPLLLEGWIGGQTAVVVLFCVSSAIYLHSRGHPISAGAVLAVLAFKPTLLLLVVPMLFVTRSFRVLLGMALGSLGALVISLWAVGYSGCVSWLQLLAYYAEVKRLAPESLKPWKYVDLRSAVYPLFYHPPLWASILLAFLFTAGTTLLLRTWWQSAKGGDWRTTWASALIWTPVLSPHFAVYDTVLLIPAAFLVAPSIRPLALIYLAAWCSQSVAQFIGFQPLTAAIVLFGLTLYQMKAANDCTCT